MPGLSVSRRAIEEDLAFGPDLGRGDEGGQDIIELGVEIVGDGGGEDPVQRIAADAQKDDDPDRRHADHAPGERAGRAARLALGRRRVLEPLHGHLLVHFTSA